jgi:addiction module HigA family antidote
MTVADILMRELVTKRETTVTDLARELQISRPALSNVLNGNADLSVELAVRIERSGFGLDARRLLIAQLDEKLKAARK